MRQTYGSRHCSVLNCSTCRCPPVSWLSAEQHFGSINLQLPNGPFYFWPRMPDHLVGREHHEGSHLLLGELLVRQPGNGPRVGNASTALRVKPHLFLWISMDLQPQKKKGQLFMPRQSSYVWDPDGRRRSGGHPGYWAPTCSLTSEPLSACCSTLSTSPVSSSPTLCSQECF